MIFLPLIFTVDLTKNLMSEPIINMREDNIIHHYPKVSKKYWLTKIFSTIARPWYSSYSISINICEV